MRFGKEAAYVNQKYTQTGLIGVSTLGRNSPPLAQVIGLVGRSLSGCFALDDRSRIGFRGLYLMLLDADQRRRWSAPACIPGNLVAFS